MNRARNLVVGAALLLVLGGCGSGVLKGPTSGQIGCPKDQVVITDDDPGWGQRTWTATCQGKVYYCSAHSSGDNGSQVSCNEANNSKSSSPSAGGCEYDGQCKGDRICTDGACVDPS